MATNETPTTVSNPDPKHFRTSGLSRIVFTVLFVVFGVLCVGGYILSGVWFYLFWAVMFGLATILNALVYFGTRGIAQENENNKPPADGR